MGELLDGDIIERRTMCRIGEQVVTAGEFIYKAVCTHMKPNGTRTCKLKSSNAMMIADRGEYV